MVGKHMHHPFALRENPAADWISVERVEKEDAVSTSPDQNGHTEYTNTNIPNGTQALLHTEPDSTVSIINNSDEGGTEEGTIAILNAINVAPSTSQLTLSNAGDQSTSQQTSSHLGFTTTETTSADSTSNRYNTEQRPIDFEQQQQQRRNASRRPISIT